MRLFGWLRGIFKGVDNGKERKKIEDRRITLLKEKKQLEWKLNRNNSYSNLSWFEIKPISLSVPKAKTYSPPPMKKAITMADLFKQREKEKEERLKQLRKSVHICFETISSFIQSEDTEQAENLLYQTSPYIKEINDEELTNQWSSLLDQVNNARETVLQKRIQKRIKETQAKEEERLRIEKEEELRQKAEIDRIKKRERETREYEARLSEQEENEVLEIERQRQIVTRKKENADEILNYLRIKGVRYFYHFTDEHNLRSIKARHGLYSWHYCKMNDIHIPNPGGDDWSRRLDCRHNLQDYVRLSFCNDHPMAYRKKQEGAHLVLLKIKIDVATFKDTLFSDENAASNSHSHGGSFSDLRKVNINATKRSYVRKEDPDFHSHQAECMVRTFLPIEYIENINSPQRI